MPHNENKEPAKTRPDQAWPYRVLPWAFLLLVCLLFFRIRGVATSPDSALYMAQALNLHHGLGYLAPDWTPVTFRGPVFPGLIALSFWLFGVSVKAALGVVRVFFVLNVLLVYALGTKLFNRSTGLIAALLVLTSATIHRWSSLVLLDNVMPFFILLALLLLFMGFEEKRKSYFGLAGFVLSIGFLTKPVAGLFFLLPLLLVVLVPAYRTKTSWRGLLLFWGVAAIVLGLWFAYATYYGGESTSFVLSVRRLVLDRLLPSESGEISDSISVQSTPGRIPQGRLSQLWFWLTDYYREQLAKQFAIAPLFLLGWGYVVVEAIRKRTRAALMLLGGLVLFLPIVLLVGRTQLREGQSFYLYLLSYLPVAYLLWTIGVDILRHRTQRILAVVLVLLVIAVQVWVGDQGFIHLLRDVDAAGFASSTRTYTMSFGKSDWEVKGWHNQAVEDAAHYLQERTAPGEPILMDWEWARSLYYYLDARQPVHAISYVESYDEDSEVQLSESPTLFLTPQRSNGVDPTIPDNYLNALVESEFLEQVRSLGTKYVVVTPRRNFLTLYLRANPSFEEVRHFGDGQIQIYHVREPVQAIQFPTHVDPAVSEYMRRVAMEAPALFQRLIDGFFLNRLGWTLSEVESLMSGVGDFESIKVNQIYSWQNEARALLASDRIAGSIEAYRRALELEPESTEAVLELAQAYVSNGQHDLARSTLSNVMLSSPEPEIVEQIGLVVDVAPEYLPAYLTQGECFQRFQKDGSQVKGLTVYDLLAGLDCVGGESPRRGGASRSAFVISKEPRGVLFLHPTAQASYALEVSGQAWLDLSLAISPEVWQLGKGDGVQFDVYVEDGQHKWHPFSEYIDPKNVPAHRRWHDREIDLSPWAGQPVTLTLATSPGPNGDDRYDWAGWGEPRIVQPIAYDFLAEFPQTDRGGADAEQVRQDVIAIDYQSRPVLFQHPTSQVAYRLEMPRRAGLHFGLGADPAVWSPDNGDGVEYNIYVRDPDEPGALDRVYYRYLDPKNNGDDRRWVDEVVDLSAYGGQIVDLIFEALPGPAGDASFDWGGWSRPVLVADDMAVLNPAPPGTASPQDVQP